MSQAAEQLPPGQYWGKKWIIYAALGIPKIRAEEWKLRVSGLVNNKLEFSYGDFLKLPMKKYSKSFHCLLPDSVVYANPEPLEISKIRLGTKIVGRDGKLHKVMQLIRKRHVGEIVGVKASYLPEGRMTPEHPVLVVRGHPGVGVSKSKRRQRTFSSGHEPSWVRADQLKSGDYVYFPKYRYVSREKYVTYIHFKFPIDKHLASIIGWYVAEGSGASSDGGINVAFSLNSGERNFASELVRDLKEVFNAKAHLYSYGTGLRVITTSNSVGRLAKMFKEWCGQDALSKHIPDFILNSEKEILTEFLRSYFKGDGYTPSGKLANGRYNDFIDLTTSSRILAYQLILALSKLGIPAEMVNHAGSVRKGYSVRARGERVRGLLPFFGSPKKIDKFHFKETDDGFYFPIRKLWTEKYEGDVYDFKAPGYTMLSPFVTQDCVTKWSISTPEWEGVPIKTLAEKSSVKPDAKWVMFHCTDGYTAPVPIEDALHEDSIVALKLNGKPLLPEQGFPARPFIPHLYGWKSAKWLEGIEFLAEYRDGYWETYGYDERGNVDHEERFKGGSGKHSKRRSFGVV